MCCLTSPSLGRAALAWHVVQLKPGGIAMQLASSQAVDEVKGGPRAGHVKIAGDDGNAPAGQQEAEAARPRGIRSKP